MPGDILSRREKARKVDYTGEIASFYTRRDMRANLPLNAARHEAAVLTFNMFLVRFFALASVRPPAKQVDAISADFEIERNNTRYIAKDTYIARLKDSLLTFEFPMNPVLAFPRAYLFRFYSNLLSILMLNWSLIRTFLQCAMRRERKILRTAAKNSFRLGN